MPVWHKKRQFLADSCKFRLWRTLFFRRDAVCKTDSALESGLRRRIWRMGSKRKIMTKRFLHSSKRWWRVYHLRQTIEWSKRWELVWSRAFSRTLGGFFHFFGSGLQPVKQGLLESSLWWKWSRWWAMLSWRTFTSDNQAIIGRSQAPKQTAKEFELVWIIFLPLIRPDDTYTLPNTGRIVFIRQPGFTLQIHWV